MQPDGWASLQLHEVPIPTPGAGEVLVKIHAVSLNFRELLIARNQFIGTPVPGLVPGCDPAGDIVAVGPGVTKWAVGERVIAGFYMDDVGGPVTDEILGTSLGAGTVQGTLQEYRVFPAAVIVRIPPHLSYVEAATLSCAGLKAYNALLGGPVPLKAGETVLLQGTGGVSLFAAQIAVLSGARVILISSSDEKLKIAASLGVQHVINYKTHPDWEQDVLALTGGAGVDHVLDIAGGTTLAKSLKALARGGQVSKIGVLDGSADAPPDVLTTVWFKAALVRGITVGSLDLLRRFVRLVDVHQMRPVVGRVFEFADTKEAFACLEKQDFVGKIVVRVSEG
ncbi:NAD(P)-binding protein [Auricularia subglabra TFB-10046 SS5]|nr:NAD(P)-binding protein [Auricularia subglabra TFB-10046 SS5]